MPAITAAVGHGAPNRRNDVVTVQTLLNQHLGELTPLAALSVDGICGMKTVNAIREFQRRVVHLHHPDGRVDPNGVTFQKLCQSPSVPPPVRRARRYRIRTVAGGGLSVFVGASVTTFQVEDTEVQQAVYYTLAGADFGFGFKAGGLQGPSSWTDFTTDKGLHDFHGYVTVVSASVNVIGGGGAFNMNFVNGPAAGLTINGIGWGTGLGASFTGTHGWMKLRD
jgi:hypothetical protein